jgi:hypothetical protein
MNFGKWVVVAFVLFAVFIGTLVVICVKQDISLVSKDYYNDELAYQDQIQRINNTNALIIKPLISKVNNSVEISFDEHFIIEKGEIKLFCPSDPESDKNFELKTSENIHRLDVTSFHKGMYKAKVSWTMQGKEYYYEEVINL